MAFYIICMNRDYRVSRTFVLFIRHFVCCILYFVCCILYDVVCCMLRSVLYIVYCMLHVACCMLHVACCMSYVVSCVLLLKLLRFIASVDSPNGLTHLLSMMLSSGLTFRPKKNESTEPSTMGSKMKGSLSSSSSLTPRMPPITRFTISSTCSPTSSPVSSAVRWEAMFVSVLLLDLLAASSEFSNLNALITQKALAINSSLYIIIVIVIVSTWQCGRLDVTPMPM